MSTEQSEPPVDSRILGGALVLVVLAALAVIFDPIAFVTWMLGFAWKGILSLLVSLVTAVIVMVIGITALTVVLAVMYGIGAALS